MKLLLLLAFLPMSVLAQKKSEGFAYIAPGGFVAKNQSAIFMPGLGIGFRKGAGAIGIAMYYSKEYGLSLDADIHLFLQKDEHKSGPFIFLQPGISFYRKNISEISSKGSFDFKGGFGFMSIKKPGLYFHIGYNSFIINTTFDTKTTKSNIKGGFMLVGVRI